MSHFSVNSLLSKSLGKLLSLLALLLPYLDHKKPAREHIARLNFFEKNQSKSFSDFLTLVIQFSRLRAVGRIQNF